MDSPCRFCSILTETPPWAEPRSVGLTDLRSGWKRGCKGCTFLYHILPSLVGPEFLEVFTSLTFEPRYATDTGPLRIVVHLDRLPYSGLLDKLRLQVYREPGPSSSPWPAVGVANHVAPHGLSQAVINLAKSWIEDCQNRAGRHANCSPHHETILPSRLVDVGSSNADGCRLYLPSENETGLYIALSHCWGGVTPTQTTQGNFESFTQQIPEPLPQTFSDAVAVTRAFGIRYLWIDSLCIIQDSPEDWALHAPLMAKVYGDAWVTISADAAADSFEGFLQHADRGRFRAVRIPYGIGGTGNCDARQWNCFWNRCRAWWRKRQWLSGRSGRAARPTYGEGRNDPAIWVRERGALGYQLPFHGWCPEFPDSLAREATQYSAEVRSRRGSAACSELAKLLVTFCRSRNSVPDSRLSTRGWVFQERALAPRTLHFGSAEVGWECRSLINCECSASSLRYRRTTSLLKRTVDDMPWHAVISEYTRLDLTVWEDRLVALAGLAEARQHKEDVDNQYAAGMWTRDLRTQLLWRTWLRRPALQSYVAPSWSWASISGSVNCPDPSHRPLLGDWTVARVHCPPADTSAFGNCQPGSYLELDGPVSSVRLLPYDEGWEVRPVSFTNPSDSIPWRLPGQMIRVCWDCDARKRKALTERHTGSFIFFLISAEDEKVEGFFLMEMSPPHGPPKETETRPASEQVTDVKNYERIAYLQEAPLARRRTWSDESSDSGVDDDSDYPKSWACWQEFARIERVRVY